VTTAPFMTQFGPRSDFISYESKFLVAFLIIYSSGSDHGYPVIEDNGTTDASPS